MALGLEAIIGYIATGKDIVDIIILLLNQEESMIRKIAEAHRLSAKQAIQAAAKGNYEQHMRVALGHLRDVFNLLSSQAKRKATWWEKLNESYGGRSPRLYEQQDLYEDAVEVAALISRKHAELGEISNAKDWADRARSVFRLYEKSVNETDHGTYGGSPLGGGSGWESGDEEFWRNMVKEKRAELEKILVLKS